MFDIYVKLPPDASPIAVNKFYYYIILFCFWTTWKLTILSASLQVIHNRRYYYRMCYLVKASIQLSQNWVTQ